jgi:hypothetical protein
MIIGRAQTNAQMKSCRSVGARVDRIFGTTV